MASLTKHLLSEIDTMSGRRFVVGSTEASAADIFHKTPEATSIDEMWVYAHNFGASDVQVTFLWGLTGMPTTSAADIYEGIDVTVPYKSGRALIFDGVLLYGGLSAAAYAAVTDTISIDGFVNRIT